MRGPLTLRRLVLLPTIYIVDSKAVLGRLIQRWSRELTRIDDVVIPCPLLHLPYIYQELFTYMALEKMALPCMALYF
jgi:hypothetical protein